MNPQNIFIGCGLIVALMVVGCSQDHTLEDEKAKQKALSQEKSKQLNEAVELEKIEKEKRKQEQLEGQKKLQKELAQMREDTYWHRMQCKWDVEEHRRQDRLAVIASRMKLAKIKRLITDFMEDEMYDKVQGQKNSSILEHHNILFDLYKKGEVDKTTYENHMQKTLEEYTKTTKELEDRVEEWFRTTTK